jgi:hypothetical protein
MNLNRPYTGREKISVWDPLALLRAIRNGRARLSARELSRRSMPERRFRELVRQIGRERDGLRDMLMCIVERCGV